MHYPHESKPQSSSQNVRSRQKLSTPSLLLQSIGCLRVYAKLICKTWFLKLSTLICKGRTRIHHHSGYCNEMKMSRIYTYTIKGTCTHNTNTDASKDT